LNVRTDDGVRVWFDGVQRVNDWGNYPPKDHTFQVALNAGERKNIRIDWFQGGGGYEAKFMWSFNGVQSIVPACRLFATAAPIPNCNFNVYAGADPSSVGCGGVSSLSAGCIGIGCGGLTYSWSGNGGTYNGSPVAITLPNTNGAVAYTLTGSKPGCANKTSVTTVTVDGCNNGCTTAPAAPTLSANPATAPTTLTASGCTGTVTWNDNSTGTTKSVNSAGTYTATCTTSGCPVSAAGNITVSGNPPVGCVVDKVRLAFRTGCCADRILGAKIQGSNDGSSWTDIYTFNQNAAGGWEDFIFTNTVAYNSVRFQAGPIGYGELSGLEFYNGTTKLLGTPIGSTGAYANDPKSSGISFMNGTGYGFWHGAVPGASNYAGLQLSGCTTPPTTCATGNFLGFLDNASCGWISGWSLDNNNLGRTVQIDIFVDGQKVTTVDANQNRPDLQPAFNNNPAAIPHGYSYAPPSNAWWKNGQNHTVTARPCGGTQDLTGSPKTVNCAPGSRIATSDESEDKSVKVYPNPTTGKIKVGFYLPKDENVWLNLYDLQGKNLQLNDFEGKAGQNQVELDLQHYPTGTYFINL
jgi:hypothetical protein